MKSTEAAGLCEWAAVLNRTEQDVAGRAGLGLGAFRVLVRAFALASSGAVVYGADLVHGHAAAVAETRRNVVALLRGEYLARVGTRGPLTVTVAGVKLCKEFAVGWGRARRQFTSFEQTRPFFRVKPRKV